MRKEQLFHMPPSKIRDSRDHFSTDYLERCDPIHAWHGPDQRLYAHARKPAHLPDQLLYLLTSLAEVKGESTGLLYLLVVPALFLTVPAQHSKLAWYLRAWSEAAGVGVARDQAQRLLLAIAGDHKRRMRPTYALRQIQGTPEPVVLPLERALVSTLAAPHSQGYPDRLLEHLEPLLLRWERDPKPLRLLLVVARAYAEAGTPAGKYIQGADGLYKDGRMAEVHPRHHRREPYPLRVRRQESERRVALWFVRLWAAHDRVLPQVVGHPDAVEVSLFRNSPDVREVFAEPLRPAAPVEAVELHSELHDSSSHSVAIRPLACMSMCLARPAPELTYLCGTPAGTTKIWSSLASIVSSPTVKVTSPSWITNTSAQGWVCRSGPPPIGASIRKNEMFAPPCRFPSNLCAVAL